MTYDEFKTYCVTHLWKTGDTVVIDALDTIIKTAEAELDRMFKVEERVELANLVFTSQSATLPTDCKSIRALINPNFGDMKYNIPADYANRLAAENLSERDFTIVNRSVKIFEVATADAPVTLSLWYYKKLTPFADFDDEDENWLVEDFLDVFLYCVLKHTAPFLREDERLATWGALYNAAFTSAMDENDEVKYTGAPLKMKFGRHVR